MLIKKPRRNDFRVKLSVAIVLCSLLIFSVFRLAFFIFHHSTFEALSFGQILAAFFNGVRFDLSVNALFLGPVILLFNLPVNSMRYMKACVMFMALELVAMTGILMADLIYFPYVNRHLTEEVLLLSTDWSIFLKHMFTSVFLPLFLLFVLLVVVGVFVHKIFKYRYEFNPYYGKGELLKVGCCILFIVMGVRGHLGAGKALNLADVYRYASSQAAASLTLNGVFTSYHVVRNATTMPYNEYPLEKAILTTQELLISDKETLLDTTFPLLRKPAQISTKKHFNIMIVVLNGWHPYYVDSLSGNKFGVTPVFDEIIKNGISFTNAYCVGNSRIYGLASIFYGVPLISGLAQLGRGLELTHFFRLPSLLDKDGYYRFLVQTFPKESDYFIPLASYLGVSNIYGKENIKGLLPYLEQPSLPRDYDGLMFTAQQIAQQNKRNFFGMTFLSTAQQPFGKTLDQFEKYPGKTWDDKFKNTLYFSDWSIGEFLKKAKEEGWFDNTIFVFVSDYVSGGPESDSLYNKFRIPLVLYAPDILKPRKINYVVSQLDILPTLYNLLGLNMPYSAFGKDMLDASDADKRVAFVSENANIGLITSKGAIRHNRKELLNVEKISEKFDEKQAQEILLSLDKTAYTLLKNNKWYRDEQ